MTPGSSVGGEVLEQLVQVQRARHLAYRSMTVAISVDSSQDDEAHAGHGKGYTSEYVEDLMKAYISGIQLGVEDLDRVKQFYGEKLGWRIEIHRPYFVSFAAEDGSSAVGFYPRAFLADDVGVAPEGSGFRGFTLSYIVRSDDRVDAVLAEAEGAGATIVKPAQRAPWGGYFGYFADPDGYLWKVVSGTYEVDGAKRETLHTYSE